MAMMSFAITFYGQCCRLHVVGQPVVSDIGVSRSCWRICSLYVLDQIIMLIFYYAWCTCNGTSILLQTANIACPTTWQRLLG